MSTPHLSADDPAAYVQAVLRYRTQKDSYFFGSPQSPIEPADRHLGLLRYFEPDPSYRVVASVERLDGGHPRVISMAASVGDDREYVELVRFRFLLAGQACELTGYGDLGDREVFVPFRDATSGDTTYGAGRYLEVEVGDSGEAIIDFNFAYNPFCAYSSSYSCPLPPLENRLAIAVEAGEKSFHQER